MGNREDVRESDVEGRMVKIRGDRFGQKLKLGSESRVHHTINTPD